MALVLDGNGQVSGVSKSSVGLNNVDNTADLIKPISTPQSEYVTTAISTVQYVHPANHPASIITQDSNNRFVSDAEKTSWNSKQSALTVPSGAIVGTTDTQTLTNKTLTQPKINGLSESSVSMTTNNIDLAAGGVFSKTITANTTFTVSNIVTGGTSVNSFILELTNGGSYTISYGTGFTSIAWHLGSAPALSASGKDILGFYTRDGGNLWYGMLMGKAFA